MGIISKIREWISRMLSKSDIKGVYGIDIAVTDSMIKLSTSGTECMQAMQHPREFTLCGLNTLL